jgi:zinc protease
MISRLEMEKEDPEARATRQFNRMVFPEGHPLRQQTVEEDQAAVGSFTREDLLAFHKKHYGPETTVIVIVGDVTPDEARASVEKYFGDWEPAGRPGEIAIPKTAVASGRSTEVIQIADKSQVNVVFGHAGQL